MFWTHAIAFKNIMLTKLIFYVAICVSGLGHVDQVDTRPQRKKSKVLFYERIVKNISLYFRNIIVNLFFFKTLIERPLLLQVSFTKIELYSFNFFRSLKLDLVISCLNTTFLSLMLALITEYSAVIKLSKTNLYLRGRIV